MFVILKLQICHSREKRHLGVRKGHGEHAIGEEYSNNSILELECEINLIRGVRQRKIFFILLRKIYLEALF